MGDHSPSSDKTQSIMIKMMCVIRPWQGDCWVGSVRIRGLRPPSVPPSVNTPNPCTPTLDTSLVTITEGVFYWSLISTLSKPQWLLYWCHPHVCWPVTTARGYQARDHGSAHFDVCVKWPVHCGQCSVLSWHGGKPPEPPHWSLDPACEACEGLSLMQDMHRGTCQWHTHQSDYMWKWKQVFIDTLWFGKNQFTRNVSFVLQHQKSEKRRLSSTKCEY